jgi:hypothetical protein
MKYIFYSIGLAFMSLFVTIKWLVMMAWDFKAYSWKYVYDVTTSYDGSDSGY